MIMYKKTIIAFLALLLLGKVELHATQMNSDNDEDKAPPNSLRGANLIGGQLPEDVNIRLVPIALPLSSNSLLEANRFRPDISIADALMEPPAALQEVYDHTQHVYNKVIDHEITNIVSSDRAVSLKQYLVEQMGPLKSKIAKNKAKELILTAVLKQIPEKRYYKYLFSSKGLLEQQAAAEEACENFKYHLVKTSSSHVLLALLEWLGFSRAAPVKSKKIYSPVVLDTNLPLCEKCYLIALHMFHIKLPCDHEKGCLGEIFPDAIEIFPRFAQTYINASLTLSLVHDLLVPMMGYASSGKVQQLQMQLAEKSATIQKNLEQIKTLQAQLARKNSSTLTIMTARSRTFTVIGSIIIAGVGVFILNKKSSQ